MSGAPRLSPVGILLPLVLLSCGDVGNWQSAGIRSGMCPGSTSSLGGGAAIATGMRGR